MNSTREKPFGTAEDFVDGTEKLCYTLIRYENSVSRFAGVAQSVEQLIRNQQVRCSSHPTSSKKSSLLCKLLFLSLFINHRLAERRQIFIRSASRISASRKSGWAMEMMRSARSQVEAPFRFTMPYSVTR